MGRGPAGSASHRLAKNPIHDYLTCAMSIPGRPSTLLLAALAALAPMNLRAADSEIKTETVTYKVGATTFEGSVSRPAPLPAGKVPGVLVFHDWMGYAPFSRARAEDLAKLGYVAFAADMYGQGVHPQNPQEAGKLAGSFYQDKEASMFRTRTKAALAELLKQPGVDPARVGAIGFCFGGTCALELARAGADVPAVVTFHGGLKTLLPARAGEVRTKEMLILHGSLDPTVPPADVANFMTEMNTAKVPYKLVAYPRAVHAFTNPAAGSDLSKPTAYSPEAAEAAYAEMREFFGRMFKQ